MKTALALVTVLAVLASGPLAHAQSSSRDEARPRDLQRLQEDLTNLDEELQALETGDETADTFRQRAEEIREETIYLKVKMRRHQRDGGSGSGVAYDEVEDLRREIADLRRDLERSFGPGEDERPGRGDPSLPEGSELHLRLDQALSSRTARREDRFDASLARPVRAGGRTLLPAGTRVRGIVRFVEPAQRPSKGGQLELDFDALYLDRTRLDLRTRVVSLHEADFSGDTAGKAGIGAVLGGVLGGILGGKKGTLIGILVGGGGAVAGSKGEDVDLPAGTLVKVRLERPLVVPRS
jgi:hypothetical protein